MADSTTGWDVVSQQPGSGQDPSGRFVQGVNVYGRTKKGHAFTVFIPQPIYDRGAAAVVGMLQFAAANADAIGGLKG